MLSCGGYSVIQKISYKWRSVAKEYLRLDDNRLVGTEFIKAVGTDEHTRYPPVREHAGADFN